MRFWFYLWSPCAIKRVLNPRVPDPVFRPWARARPGTLKKGHGVHIKSDGEGRYHGSECSALLYTGAGAVSSDVGPRNPSVVVDAAEAARPQAARPAWRRHHLIAD